GAEQGVGQTFAAARGIQRTGVEVDCLLPVEVEFVESADFDGERSLEVAGGGKVGGVPGVADADLLERGAIGAEVGLRPGEVETEEVAFAGSAVALRILGRLCGAAEAALAAAGLHRLVFLGGDVEVNRPHLCEA